MLKTRGVTFVRLYFQKYKKYYCTSTSPQLKNNDGDVKVRQTEPNKEIIDEIRGKILFNTLLENLKSEYGTRRNFFLIVQKKHEEKLIEEEKKLRNAVPLSLKYFTDDPSIVSQIEDFENEKERDIIERAKEVTERVKSRYTFPYDREEQVIVNDKWMSDYETYKEDKDVLLQQVHDEDVLAERETEEENSLEEIYEKHSWRKNYGTPDPNSKESDVQCGGCGATLHCKDSSIPGYLPSEIFKNASPADLQRIICQRCHFLKEYNLALGVSVRPQDYEQMLRTIQPHKALILLMVDLLDFPCSIWPNILDIVGRNKPIVVVGNKVDLIPQSSAGYLQHMENVLKQSVQSNLGNVKIQHVSLISAKTGWGVEELISKLYKVWAFKGDVYIVGTTNVGKSSLFNILLQSDYCKVQAADLIHRATISPWPGTTLNLLKFPILRPSGVAMHLRYERLKAKWNNFRMEEKLRHQMIKQTGDTKYATLMQNVERSFPNLNNTTVSGDPFSYSMATGFKESGPAMGVSEKNKKYMNSRWCYDTPGVVHRDQIITLLTIEELLCTLPKQLIRPKTFYLFENQTLFIAGIARVDVLTCERALRLNVFASNILPVTVCNTEDADLIYSKLLGTDYFKVPKGDKERLSKWPKLQKFSQDIEMEGLGWHDSIGDIVLSSGGWLSVNAQKSKTVKLAAWIVGGRGIYVRNPPLVAKACQMKGTRIEGTPAYNVGELFVDHKRITSQR